MNFNFFIKIMCATAMLMANVANAVDTIKVGVLYSLSGLAASEESIIKDATLMAIDEINSKGGVLGRKLEPIVRDGGSNYPLYKEKAKSLIVEDGVSVIFGGDNYKTIFSVKEHVEEQNILFFYSGQYKWGNCGGNIICTGYSVENNFNYIQSNFLSKNNIKNILFSEKERSGIIESIKIIFNVSNGKLNLFGIDFDRANDKFFKSNRELFENDKNVGILFLSEQQGDIKYPFEHPDLLNLLVVKNYSADLLSSQNRLFVNNFYQYKQKKRIEYNGRPNTSIESAYLSVLLWAAAVEKSKTLNTDSVARVLNEITINAPSGNGLKIERQTNCLQRNIFVGTNDKNNRYTASFQSEAAITTNSCRSTKECACEDLKPVKCSESCCKSRRNR